MGENLLEGLPRSVVLLYRTNELYHGGATKEWELDVISREHWNRTLHERKKPLRSSTCAEIGKKVFELSSEKYKGNAEEFRSKLCTLAKEFGWKGQLEDFSAGVFSEFLENLAQSERRTDKASPGKVEVPDKDSFYKDFWHPLKGRHIAILGVWAPGSHYDLIPLMLLNREISTKVSTDLKFMYFDERGRAVIPSNPTYHRFKALCPVGRPGLYSTCPLLWNAGRSILPMTKFTMPPITAETSRHLKSFISPSFHSVRNNTGLGNPVYTAKDERDFEIGRKERTDYALIQRLFIPEKDLYLVLLHGCTALGTQVAVSQATVERFSMVECRSSIAADDNLEILIKTRAGLEWSIEDERALQRRELVTKPWLDVWGQQLFVCINDNVVTSPKDGHKAGASGIIESRQTPTLADEADALRDEFRRFKESMEQRYRYSSSKYKALLRDKWEYVRRIARGENLMAPPSYFEIHPGERCQLQCKFCRGGLRWTPAQKRQKALSRANLLKAIDDLHAMNPTAFVRFTGIIGEPFMHPNILDAFERIKELGTLRWGVSTNGLLLHKENAMELLLSADYVHVSLDAGSDKVYRRLKGAHAGDLVRALENIGTLVKRRNEAKSHLEIVVSFLLQEDNYKQVPELSKKLKQLGVNTFEVKMQHFDKRRHMNERSVHEAYRLLEQAQADGDGTSYVVAVVQSEEAAISKIRGDAQLVDFDRCYANLLGLNSAVDARGRIETCCQYFDTAPGSKSTLGVQGTLSEGLARVWDSPTRKEILSQDPRTKCNCCSPSDEFINRFVAFLRRANHTDPSFLDWVEREYFA